MTYLCLRRRATAQVLCVLLFLLTLLFGILSSLNIGWRGIWQLLMLASLVAVIQISQRYLLSGYEYILDPADEILLRNRLTIVRTQGKKRFAVITLNLKNLTAVIPPIGTGALTEEYGKISARMNFCPDMFPSESVLLLFTVDDELSVIKLQCGEDFAEELRRRAGV